MSHKKKYIKFPVLTDRIKFVLWRLVLTIGNVHAVFECYDSRIVTKRLENCGLLVGYTTHGIYYFDIRVRFIRIYIAFITKSIRKRRNDIIFNYLNKLSFTK